MLNSIALILTLALNLLISAQTTGNPVQIQTALDYANQAISISQSLMVSVSSTQSIQNKTEQISSIEFKPESSDIKPLTLGSASSVSVSASKKVDIDFGNITTEMVNYFYHTPESLCSSQNIGNSNARSPIPLPGVDYLIKCDLSPSNGVVLELPAGGVIHIPLNWLKENKIIPRNIDDIKSINNRYSCENVVRMVDNKELVNPSKYESCKAEYSDL